MGEELTGPAGAEQRGVPEAHRPGKLNSCMKSGSSWFVAGLDAASQTHRRAVSGKAFAA